MRLMNMKSPFYGNEKAFDPFYEEDAIVELKGGQKQTVKVLVMTDNTADPTVEEMLDTDEESIAVTFRKQDWAYLADIKRGDRITFPAKGLRKQKVYSV